MNPNDAPQEHSAHPAETALEPSCAGGLGHPAGSPSREHAAEAGWISVVDRLPEPHQSVALLSVERWECGAFDRNVHDAGYLEDYGNSFSPFWSIRGARAETLASFTHWMPLPAAPAEPELCSHARAEAAWPDVVKGDDFEQDVEELILPWLDVSIATDGMTPTQRVLAAVKAMKAAALASSPAVQAVPAGWLQDHEIPPEGSPLQKLGARLAELLDDDKWNNIEPMLFAVARQLASAPQAPALEPIQTQDSRHQAERLIPDAHRDGEASS